MTALTQRARSAQTWRLARQQHGVITHRQLSELGFSASAIKHRQRTGRLFQVHRGVYSVGRSELPREGGWMAAILACGEGAFLTHLSAGAHYGVCEERPGRIEVGVTRAHLVGPPDLRVRRRLSLRSQDVGHLQRIPITSPVRTMLDLATVVGPKSLARAVNEADKLEVIDVETLRRELGAYAGQAGVRPLRTLLDRDTFVLTEEELERLFLPLARDAGLPLPKTKEMVNGYEVDFFWPELRLVVETDGLRYHRTPLAQAKDVRRDQTHTAAGYTRLRFSHHQVKYEPAYVRDILSATAARLSRIHT